MHYQDKIKIKLISPAKQKLQLVKLIKEFSGMGLRDSKDLCDSLHDNPHLYHDMPIDRTITIVDPVKRFTLELKNIDGQFLVNSGIQWERDVKILKLGIADKSDYSDFLKNYIFSSFENSENILNLALSKLSKEQLEEVFNQINIEI